MKLNFVELFKPLFDNLYQMTVVMILCGIAAVLVVRFFFFWMPRRLINAVIGPVAGIGVFAGLCLVLGLMRL